MKIWVQKRFESKENFWSEKKYKVKRTLGPKNLGPKNFGVRKKFCGYEESFVPKKIWVQK